MSSKSQQQNQSQRKQQDPSLITQFSRFMHSYSGLEKSLRLLQAFVQIGAAVESQRGVDDELAQRLWGVKGGLSVARRYFRFFNFIDCFGRVYALLGSSSSSSTGNAGTVTTLIDLMRWTCFGLYFLLEDFTILHAMNLYSPPWTKGILIHAHRFWFYALFLSVVRGVWGLLVPVVSSSGSGSQSDTDKKEVSEKPKSKTVTTGTENGNKKSSSQSKSPPPSSTTDKTGKTPSPTPWPSPLAKRLIVDGCDLFIPGSYLGWVPVGSLEVGVVTVVSTLIAMGDIWVDVQRGGHV